MKTIQDVRHFWEEHPLWTGESRFAPGSREFFDEHRRVVLADCHAGRLDPRLLPERDRAHHVLDLGCGPGFWTVELGTRGCRRLVAADLTHKALELARTRCHLYGVPAQFIQQNAESLGFHDESFDHVNCQGVIHHTPSPEACVREIARVLKKGGTALISVYYENIFLKCWPILRLPAKLVDRCGGGLKGRGRERIFSVRDGGELVRLYDGRDNPIGRSFSRSSLFRLVTPHLAVKEVFLHSFPARALPFSTPGFVHRFLDRHVGFMIYCSLHKR